jgi:thiol-disulfide isomerase/thioredoxin
MKKKLLIGGTIIVVALFLLSNFGITIGNVTIGHQEDNLKVKQSLSIENSNFSKKYLKSEKIVCLNLWATWCVPCVEEMPMLNKVKGKYQNENIEFLSLSMDTDSTRLSKFINKNKFDFKDITFENLEYKNSILNFLENKPLDEVINSQSIPITYLIKNNKVIKKIDGQAEEKELITEIDKALNK